MALKGRITRLQKAVEPQAFRNVFCCEKHMDWSLVDPRSPILFVETACPERRRGETRLLRPTLYERGAWRS